MSTIDTTTGISSPYSTGIDSGTPVETQTVSAPTVSSPFIIPEQSEFVLSSLSSLGLPPPSNPGDLEALFELLWLKLESSLNEIAKQNLKAEYAPLLSVLGAFRANASSKEGYVALHGEKSALLDSKLKDLADKEERREELEDRRDKLDKKIDKSDNPIEKAILRDEKKEVEKKLDNVIEDIARLESEIAALEAEVATLAGNISLIDSTYLFILTLIVRERAPVNSDVLNEEARRVAISDEIIRTNSESLSLLRMNEVRQAEFVATLKKLGVRMDEKLELELKLALTALQVVLDGLPVQSDEGVQPSPPGQVRDSGGRILDRV
jgi:DNA repair exonuclease SbcCD ATPase subunit